MTIVEMRVVPVAMADPPLRSAFGLHAPYALRTIIELISDDKIVGISETYGGDAQVKQLEALRSQVIEANPYRLTGFLSPMIEGAVGNCDRPAHFGICTARARHSVSASKR